MKGGKKKSSTFILENLLVESTCKKSNLFLVATQIQTLSSSFPRA